MNSNIQSSPPSNHSDDDGTEYKTCLRLSEVYNSMPIGQETELSKVIQTYENVDKAMLWFNSKSQAGCLKIRTKSKKNYYVKLNHHPGKDFVRFWVGSKDDCPWSIKETGYRFDREKSLHRSGDGTPIGPMVEVEYSGYKYYVGELFSSVSGGLD